MSLRNIRKIYGGTQLPPPDEGSDEEFEPAYTQNHTKSIYAGLEVSSDSEENDSEEVVVEQPEPEISKKKTHKKKKKQRKPKEKVHVDAKTDDGLDDIDKCVMEINAVLGEPQKPPEVIPDKDPIKIRKRLFTVRQQHLVAEAELNRRFGPDEDEDPKKRGRQPNLRIIAQKGFIIDTDRIYKKRGLSMALLERKNNAIYYAFVHSKDYQRLHRTFLYTQEDNPPHVLFPLEESQHRMHVEGLLETADRYYYVEEYTSGNKVIEEVISYMQQCAHPFFSVTDIRARLEYKHVQNRAFHIALMKYMHMLTNKACHRTALEIAKLLLNLDPSDPLAVLFIIDTIAIRAGEYQWVIDAIDYWNEERDAGFLFNMQYSYALATFHLALKQKAGFEDADELLQKAMIKFPSVVSHMLQNAGIKNPKIQDCPLFKIDANDGTSSNLKDLIVLYARFIWHKFIQSAVNKWLIRNATELVDKYYSNPEVRAEAKAYANVRMNLFQSYPQEILRHLSILTPLNTLIVDGAVPEIESVVSFDPFPPLDSVNVYERRETSIPSNIFYDVISNLMPDQDLQDGGLDREGELPRAVQSEVPFEAVEMLRRRHLADDSDTDDDTLLDDALHMDLLDALGPLPVAGQNASGAARFYSEVYVSIAMMLQDTDEELLLAEDEEAERMEEDGASHPISDDEADILLADDSYLESEDDVENNIIDASGVNLLSFINPDIDVCLNGEPSEQTIDDELIETVGPLVEELYDMNEGIYDASAVLSQMDDTFADQIPVDDIPEIEEDDNRIEDSDLDDSEASYIIDDLLLGEVLFFEEEEFEARMASQDNTGDPQDTEDEPPASEDEDSLTLSDINDESDYEEDSNSNNGEGPDDRSDGGEPDGGNGAEEGDDEDEDDDDDSDDDADDGDGNEDDDEEDEEDDDDEDDNDTDSDDDENDEDYEDDEGSSDQSDPAHYHNRMIQSLRDHAHTEYRRSVLEARVQNGVVHQHRLLYLQRQRELENLPQPGQAEPAQADPPQDLDDSDD